MAASAPRLGVDHPTVVPIDPRRADDADEAPTDDARTDGSPTSASEGENR